MMEERRQHDRVDVEQNYFCLPDNMKRKIRCNLKNISVTGACISSRKMLNKDDVVLLHVKGLRNSYLKSRVVWKIEDNYGLLFFLETSQDFSSISFIINNATGVSS
jgi:hypothetical protein